MSAKADRDVMNIFKHIVIDNAPAAARFYALLHEKFGALAVTPGMGVASDHIDRGTRKVPVGEYLIYYRPGRDRLLICRVLHGKRRQKQAYYQRP